jgi:chemosensory pili system protein ChpA (sensor histidine kinase/response regulator)
MKSENTITSGFNEITLGWVSHEINNSLVQAKQYLEAYQEHGDSDDLEACWSQMHHLRNTLVVINLHGASMLTDELEAVLKFLLKRQVTGKEEDILQAIFGGILSLQDYLERIEKGAPDVPVILLPVLNELRASRQKHLLSESAFFSPRLKEMIARELAQPFEEDGELRRYLVENRSRFHLSLLKWFQNSDASSGLAVIREILDGAAQLAERPVSRLFTLGAQLASMAWSNIGESSIATKLIIGHIDAIFRTVITSGESGLREKFPVERLRNMLFYVGQSESDSPEILKLKEEYSLDAELAGKQSHIPSPATVEAVRGALTSDITELKDVLDIYNRSITRDNSILKTIAPRLRQVADTVGMLGLGNQRQLLLEHANVVNACLANDSEIENEFLEKLANDLLGVETVLPDLFYYKPREESSSRANLVSEADLQQYTTETMSESLTEVAKVKDLIIKSLDAGEQQPLIEVPLLLRRLAGVMRMLNLEHLSGMILQISRYIEHHLDDSQVLLGNDESVNKLADIVSGLEYYLEVAPYRCRQEREILDYLTAEIDKLTVPEESEHVATPEDEQGLAGEAETEETAETTDLQPVAGTEEEPEQAAELTLEHEDDIPQEAALQSETASVPESYIDEEILDIFRQEAQEQLETIEEFYPSWKRDHDDVDSLQAVRRAFHTLKGSGRTVGASLIAEFSWEIENLLNNVIDGIVSPDQKVLALLDRAIDYLPGLLDDTAPPDGEREYIEQQARNILLSVSGKQQVEETVTPVESGTAPDRLDTLRDAWFALTGFLRQLKHCADAATDCKPESFNENMHELRMAAEREESAGLTDLANLGAAMNLDQESTSWLNQELLDHCQHCHAELQSHHEEIDSDESEEAGEINVSIRSLREETEEIIRDLESRLHAVIETGQHTVIEVTDEEPARELTTTEIVTEEVPETSVEDADTMPAGESLEETVETGIESAGAGEAAAQAGDENPEEHAEPEDDLLPVFLEEAKELNEKIEGVFKRTDVSEGFTVEAAEELKRLLHTLKGAARLTGNNRLGDVTHAFETMLIQADEQDLIDDSRVYTLSRKAADYLHQQIEHLENRQPAEESSEILALLESPLEVIRKVSEEREEHPDDALAEKAAGDTAVSGTSGKAEAAPEESRDKGRITAEIVAFPRRRRPVVTNDANKRVRISTNILDRLVDGVGEVITFGSRLQQQRNGIRSNLNEFEQTLKRLREQLRSLEIEAETHILSHYQKDTDYQGGDGFDPLELDQYSAIQEHSRALAETISDLGNISMGFDQAQHEIDMLLSQHSRLASDLQDVLLHTRTVPFTQHVPRLTRLVRQTCASTGKKADLRIHGEEQEMDRGVLDRTIPLLEHLLRNAVYHGIEQPEARLEAGKKEQGLISVTLAREGMEIVLTVSDDGRGFDRDAIRKRALQKGLVSADDDLGDEDILRLATLPGFSTADSVDQISGRGVGLDVVVNEIENLGGRLNIESLEGEGATFRIHFPFNIAITDALMIFQQGVWYAIPSSSIDSVVRVTMNELDACYSGRREGYTYGDKLYRVIRLGDYFGQDQQPPADKRKWHSLLLISSGDKHIALHPEEVHGHSQIVLKPVGPQLESVPWIIGGSVKGDGNAAIVIDPTALINLETEEKEEAVEVQEAAEQTLTVMVIDDSITMRKVTGSMLERNGYNIMTAKDGVDALAQLEHAQPDIMLLDIEMPRMDGFELARHLRNNELYQHIPIIMVTSRTGEKHRERARELSIESYMGKPFQERELLESINELTAGRRVSA